MAGLTKEQRAQREAEKLAAQQGADNREPYSIRDILVFRQGAGRGVLRAARHNAGAYRLCAFPYA